MSVNPTTAYCTGCRSYYPLGSETRLYQFPAGVPSEYVRVCICGTTTHVEIGDVERFKRLLTDSMVNVIEIRDPLP